MNHFRPSAKPLNPLETAVAAIEENKNYLTPDLVRRLQQVLPEKVESMMPESDNSLDGMLSKLGRMVSRLEMMTRDEKTTPAEMKSAIMAAKDMFKLLADYGQDVAAEKKISVLRKTVIDVLSDFSTKDRERFMKMWEERLKKAATE